MDWRYKKLYGRHLIYSAEWTYIQNAPRWLKNPAYILANIMYYFAQRVLMHKIVNRWKIYNIWTGAPHGSVVGSPLIVSNV